MQSIALIPDWVIPELTHPDYRSQSPRKPICCTVSVFGYIGILMHQTQNSRYEGTLYVLLYSHSHNAHFVSTFSR